MGAQHHPRQIRATWLSALRTDGGLKSVTSANRQITTATNRVQKVGSRKKISTERRRFLFFLNPPRWPTAITLCVPSGFSLCRRYRPGSALLLLHPSSFHRSISPSFVRHTYNDSRQRYPSVTLIAKRERERQRKERG